MTNGDGFSMIKHSLKRIEGLATLDLRDRIDKKSYDETRKRKIRQLKKVDSKFLKENHYSYDEEFINFDETDYFQCSEFYNNLPCGFPKYFKELAGLVGLQRKTNPRCTSTQHLGTTAIKTLEGKLSSLSKAMAGRESSAVNAD